MTKELKIMIGVLVGVVALGIILYAITPHGSQSNSGTLVRDNSHMTGPRNAKVTVVEFADYQCPYCAQTAPVVAQAIAYYKGNPDVSFVFRHFPLSQHQWAMLAAESAEAAAAQGKFWEMTEKIYAGQQSWENSSNASAAFTGYAQELGLDMNKFSGDISTGAYAGTIQTDKNDALALGVNSTPTFFINGEKLNTLPTLETFKSRIDALLK